MKKSISTILPLLFITLLCVVAVEGFYAVVEKYLQAPAEETRIVSQVPERKQVDKATPQRTPDGDVRRILARNLFGPPPSAGKEDQTGKDPAEELQPTSLSLVLMGTIISDGQESRAIILEKTKKKQDIYHQGDVVEGAILKEILRKKVVLTYNDKDEILDMTEAAEYAPKIPPTINVAPVQRQLQRQAQAQARAQAQAEAQAQAQAQAQAEEQAQAQQELPEPEFETEEQFMPEPEPQAIEEPESPPDSPASLSQPRMIRPNPRIYAPSQGQPSQ